MIETLRKRAIKILENKLEKGEISEYGIKRLLSKMSGIQTQNEMSQFILKIGGNVIILVEEDFS